MKLEKARMADILGRHKSEAARPPVATGQCVTSTGRLSSSPLSKTTPGNSDKQCAQRLQNNTSCLKIPRPLSLSGTTSPILL